MHNEAHTETQVDPESAHSQRDSRWEPQVPGGGGGLSSQRPAWNSLGVWDESRLQADLRLSCNAINGLGIYLSLSLSLRHGLIVWHRLASNQ